MSCMRTIDPYVACSNLNPVSFPDFVPSFVLRLLASACRIKASKWAEKNHHVDDGLGDAVRKCTAGNVDPIMFYRCGLHPILCHGRFIWPEQRCFGVGYVGVWVCGCVGVWVCVGGVVGIDWHRVHAILLLHRRR